MLLMFDDMPRRRAIIGGALYSDANGAVMQRKYNIAAFDIQTPIKVLFTTSYVQERVLFGGGV
jgi:hypothetical protein